MKARALAFHFIFLFTATLSIFADPQRPVLQVLNGSDQPVEIFWMKSESETVPNGTVAPGKETFITTILGHRFKVVGSEDKTERLVTSEVPVQAFRFDPPDPDGIPVFYTQRVGAGGFPIVASAKVNPYALKEAAFLLDRMLANRPDVRTAMIKSGARLCIHAHDEFTTDLPEFARLGEKASSQFLGVSGKDYWDARARGLGGSERDPFCSCAEENVLGYPGDPYAAECILIHEFAHNIHLRGLVNVDPTFDPRLKAAYEAAMKAGLWKGKYASVNHHEYFAEGVQSWFDDNRENDHDHNHVDTRAELLDYDARLAAICREVFGDTELTYTKPETRLTGHLAGYDPAKAPTFVWPEHLEKTKALIRGNAVARGAAAEGSRVIEGWSVHLRPILLRDEPDLTAKALALLQVQLEEIVRVVPAPALAELREVPLWFSPEYAGVPPRAEYHGNVDWLESNGRDPAMAKGVEFTNIRIFEAETKRMPNFALHELAHAYHDRVLPMGFANPEIRKAYQTAKEGGTYDRVERWRGNGKPNTVESAYAMTSSSEYFAEATEGYFSRNDFFPFTLDELRGHDPAMVEVLERAWGVKWSRP